MATTAKKNGTGKEHHEDPHTARMRERSDLQVATLRGDVRDAVLRLVRELPDHWRKMTGGAQEDAIGRIERLSNSVVEQCVEIVAARGADFQIVRLGKMTIDKSVIEGKFTMPYTNEALTALSSRQNQEIVLVAREADQFKGERSKAESDNIGDLAIPRGRPSIAATMAEPSAEDE
jgi:hypothetical protein